MDDASFIFKLGSRPLRPGAWEARALRLEDAPFALILIALYYGTAHLGFAVQFTGPVAALVWLPVGVGIGFLYLYGLRYWPAVLAGDLLVNNYASLPLGSAIMQSFGNLLEVVVAAWLMRRLVPDDSPLGSVRRLALVLAALAAGTAISATIGLIALRLGDVVSAHAVPTVWRTWWLGDLCGALIVVPLMLAWHVPPSREWVRGRAAEGILLILAVVGLSGLSLHTARPIAYLVLPGLILAALRFGLRGATIAVAIAAGYAVWATTHYVGPFHFHSITRSVLLTQLYIVAAALSTLAIAAVASERDDYAARLRASRARLAKAGDVERERIEHNLHDGAQQRLTALAVYLGIAAEETRHSPERAPALFQRAERDLIVAIDELRDLAHGLQPPVLKQHGLGRAIRSVAARSPIPVTLAELPTQRFDDGAETTAYFVVVEAFANAQKHSDASWMRARAKWSHGMLLVEVADDGRGGAKEDGGGLQGLRDRVEAYGGRFEVDSPEGRGTRIRASVPASVTRL
jgi:signal transduction histidine kinase